MVLSGCWDGQSARGNLRITFGIGTWVGEQLTTGDTEGTGKQLTTEGTEGRGKQLTTEGTGARGKELTTEATGGHGGHLHCMRRSFTTKSAENLHHKDTK